MFFQVVTINSQVTHTHPGRTNIFIFVIFWIKTNVNLYFFWCCGLRWIRGRPIPTTTGLVVQQDTYTRTTATTCSWWLLLLIRPLFIFTWVMSLVWPLAVPGQLVRIRLKMMTSELVDRQQQLCGGSRWLGGCKISAMLRHPRYSNYYHHDWTRYICTGCRKWTPNL